MARYFVKLPVSGWHEVDQEKYDGYIAFLRKYATPSIPIDDLISQRTKTESE